MVLTPPFLFRKPSVFKFFCRSLRNSASSPLVSVTQRSLLFFFVSPLLRLALCLLHFSFLCPYFFFILFGISGKNSLFFFPSFLSVYNGCQVIHSFSNMADELATRGVLLQQYTVSSSISTLTYCIHLFVFSSSRRTGSSKFLVTHKIS